MFRNFSSRCKIGVPITLTLAPIAMADLDYRDIAKTPGSDPV